MLSRVNYLFRQATYITKRPEAAVFNDFRASACVTSLLSRHNDQLIEACFLRVFPRYLSATVSSEQLRQFFPAGRFIFADKLADAERFLILDTFSRVSGTEGVLTCCLPKPIIRLSAAEPGS